MLAVHAADTDADPSPGFPGRSPPPPPPWHSSVPVARPATPPRRRRRLQLGGLPPQCPHPTPHPSDFTAAAAAAASGRVWPSTESTLAWTPILPPTTTVTPRLPAPPATGAATSSLAWLPSQEWPQASGGGVHSPH